MDYEGLCDSNYFYRNGKPDHWFGKSKSRYNGKLVNLAWNHVSPSQIETFNNCKRLWFFKSILKIPEIQKGHQALGESFHLILEKVGAGGTWPNHADTRATPEEWVKAEQMAKIALPLLPIERNGILIKREHGIRLDTYPGGPTMIGYVDLGVPPGLGMPALLVPDNEAIVGDYKTLSDFRYMKTPEELANSVQMMTYAKWAIEEEPFGLIPRHDLLDLHSLKPTVRLLHLYARTKPPFNRNAVRHESAIVGVSEINTFWNKTLDTVREMATIAHGHQTQANAPNDIEAGGALNGHCEAYGGCSFRDKCGINQTSGIKNIFSIKPKPTLLPLIGQTPPMSGSGFLDKIKAAREAQSASPSPVETPINPATVPVKADAVYVPDVAKPSAGPISGLISKIEAQGKGKPSLGGAAAQSYGKEINSQAPGFAGTGELGTQNVNTVGELLKLASGIIPPDAPPRTQAIITQPGTPVVDPSVDGESEVGETEDESDTETSSSSATTDVSTNHASPTDVATDVISNTPGLEPAKKRGRPSREEMQAREAAEKAKFDAAVRAEALKLTNTGLGAMDRDQLWETERVALEARVTKAEAIADQANRKLLERTIPVTTGCTLYIDCYPTKGDKEGLVDFFEWIGPIAAAVAQSNGVQDYRLINYTSKGLLASAIRELVKAEGLPRAMTLPMYAGGVDIALEILVPLAKTVIRKL